MKVMTDQQTCSVTRSVRFLSALSGILLTSIGFGVWRISPAWLASYRESGVSGIQALDFSGSPYAFGGAVLVSAAIVAATWRLPINTAAWLTVAFVILTWLTFV